MIRYDFQFHLDKIAQTMNWHIIDVYRVLLMLKTVSDWLLLNLKKNAKKHEKICQMRYGYDILTFMILRLYKYKQNKN